MPSVTVIVVSYNHESFILDALNSLGEAGSMGMQIVIIDDFSRDTTRVLIEKWVSEHPSFNITTIFNQKNIGLVATLNRAIEEAKNDYIALLSGDDYFVSGQLIRQSNFLDVAGPKVGAVYSDMRFVNEDGSAKGRWRWGLPFRIESNFHNVHAELLRYNFIPSVATLFKRTVFEQLGGFNPDYFYEDYGFWLKLSRHYEIAYLPGIATEYRLTASSLSRSEQHRQKMWETNLQIFDDQIGVSPRGDRIIARRVFGLVLNPPDFEIDKAIAAGEAILEKTSTGHIYLRVTRRKVFFQSWFRRLLRICLFYGARILNGMRLLAIYVTRKLPWMLLEVTKRRQSRP